MMDAFWAVPEWAPADESHLLGSLSPVTKISYGTDSVTYSTFDAESSDVLRLDFAPESVMAGGKPLQRKQDLAGEGFTFDETTRVLRIHHVAARDVSVQGKGGNAVPLYVTFDDPHVAAGTVLRGEYPSGVMDWPDDDWQIGVPGGKFGTFNLVLRNPEAESAEWRFAAPRILIGFDVCNDGTAEATVTVSAEGVRETAYKIRPGELVRVRTGWRDAASRVKLEFQNGRGLRFDNVAYGRP